MNRNESRINVDKYPNRISMNRNDSSITVDRNESSIAVDTYPHRINMNKISTSYQHE